MRSKSKVTQHSRYKWSIGKLKTLVIECRQSIDSGRVEKLRSTRSLKQLLFFCDPILPGMLCNDGHHARDGSGQGTKLYFGMLLFPMVHAQYSSLFLLSK